MATKTTRKTSSGRGDLHEVNGRMVSKRSKTGNSMCSQAMSDWKRHGMNPTVAKVLGKCRAMASALKQAKNHRAAGNTAKAAVLEHRAATGKVGKENRAELARALIEARRSKQGGGFHLARNAAETQTRAGFAPGGPGTRPRPHDPLPRAKASNLAFELAQKAKTRQARLEPAKPKPAPKKVDPPHPDHFQLRQASAHATAKPAYESISGKTPFMFDMKKGDLKGQTTIMDRFGTRHTSEPSERPAKPAPSPVDMPHHEIAQQIRSAVNRINKGDVSERTHLADLREALPHIPRHKLDESLLNLVDSKHISMFRLDNPREIFARDRAAVLHTEGGAERHIMYMGHSFDTNAPYPGDSPTSHAARTKTTVIDAARTVAEQVSGKPSKARRATRK